MRAAALAALIQSYSVQVMMRACRDLKDFSTDSKTLQVGN
jgi:hypothetical protein